MALKALTGAIQVHIRDPWASVPVRLMEAGCGLSPEARLVLIYMLDLGRRPNWTIYAAQVQRALGLGPRRWPRIRRELEAGGYFRAERGHKANGDWEWSYHVFDEPAGIPPSSIPAKCMDADCVDAKRGDRHNSTLSSFTSRRRKEAEAPPPAADAAAAPQSRKSHHAPGVYHGCRVHAGTDDRERVDACIAKRGVEWVETFAGNRLPLPSEVEQAMAADARREQRRERAALLASGRPTNHTNPDTDAAAFEATLAGLHQENTP